MSRVLKPHRKADELSEIFQAAGLAVGFWKDVSEVSGMLQKAGGHEKVTPTTNADERALELSRWQN